MSQVSVAARLAGTTVPFGRRFVGRRRSKRAPLIRSKVNPLLANGDSKVREAHYSDDEGRVILGHVVMLDPEGNEFCVA